MVNAIDGIGQALANAALEGDNLKDSLQAVIYEFASTGLTQGLKLGVNEGAQGLFNLLSPKPDSKSGTGTGETGSLWGSLGSLFGFGGDKGSDGETGKTDGWMGIVGSMLGMGGGTEGAATEYGTLNVTAGVVNITDGLKPVVQPAAQVPAAAPATTPAAGESGGFFSEMMDGLVGIFDGLKTGLTDAIGGLGSLLTGVLGSLFGGVGSDSGGDSRGTTIAKWAVGTVMSYYGGGGAGGGAGGGGGGGAGGGGGYTGAFGFAEGGMPSRKILGPRGQRDNLLATANVNGQATPIRVESDEGILSRKAMSAIGGESGLKLLNSGKMPRFSVGGAPAPDYNSGGTTKTGTDAVVSSVKESAAAKPAGDSQVNIANIYSEQGFADFVSSRGGRKVIINMMKEEGLV